MSELLELKKEIEEWKAKRPSPRSRIPRHLKENVQELRKTHSKTELKNELKLSNNFFASLMDRPVSFKSIKLAPASTPLRASKKLVSLRVGEVELSIFE